MQNLRLSTISRRLLRCVMVATTVTLSAGALVACGGNDSSSGGGSSSSSPVEVTLKGESDLFPSFDFSTGLLPADSPVQASFTLAAAGAGKVSAVAAPSGSASAPTLTGVPGKGTLTIDGGFSLEGELKVALTGLPSYDGPIPGIENVKIPVKGSAKFDPFAIDHPASVRADIPATKLPGIPLPGGIPGKLVFEIAEGSFMSLDFAGACAGIDDGKATYSGQIRRSGTLILIPSIEIDLPVPIGTQSYPIPKFSVDLALGSTDVDMSAKVEEFGSEPSEGDHQKGSCKASHGTGGAGQGGGGGTSEAETTGSGTGGTSSSSTSGMGASGPGSGVGGGGNGGSGGGVACSSDADCSGAPCVANQCMGGPICDAGIVVSGTVTEAACLSDHCCGAFEMCTFFGSTPDDCIDCFNMGGGPGTICQDALTCAQQFCGF